VISSPSSTPKFVEFLGMGGLEKFCILQWNMLNKELKLEWHEPKRQELRAAMENVPYAEDGLFTEEDLATGRVKFIGTGHAAAIEHQRKFSGRPKATSSVSFRITPELLKGLRATGRGWQIRAINYLMEGLKKGKLTASTN